MSFDYYYGLESESFSFYRIPRLLVTDPRFRGLSSDAKLLYGLLLDRMGLSMRNGWLDEQDRVYIYYTVEEIQEDLACGHVKAGKLLAELDTAKGIGLIERVKQGQGKPTKIYVLQFTTANQNNCTPFRPPKSVGQEVSNVEVKTSTFDMSRPIKSGGADLHTADASYINNNQTYENQTYKSYTDPSIHLSPQTEDLGQMDRWKVRELVKEQIEYDLLTRSRRDDPLLDTLTDLITDILRSNAPSERINGADIPMRDIQTGFQTLTYDHIVYIVDAMHKNTTEITNMRAYLLTALFNAPRTMGSYYDAAVRHDFS